MQVAIRRVLPTARQRLARPARLGLPRPSSSCRPRARHPLPCLPARCFSSTAAPRYAADDPLKPHDKPFERAAGAPEPDRDNAAGAPPEQEGEAYRPEDLDEVAANGFGAGAQGGNGDRPARTRGRPVGSKTRRIVKNFPKAVMPEWFMQHGVVLREDNLADTQCKLVIHSDPDPEQEILDTIDEAEEDDGSDDELLLPPRLPPRPETEKPDEPAPPAEAERASPVPPAPEPGRPSDETTRESEVKVQAGATTDDTEPTYRLHGAVWRELKAHVRTGLMLPKTPYADNPAAMKSHCLVHFPKDGGVYFLDAVAEKLAAEEETDLIRIDAQDLAEIAGDYLGDSRSNSVSQSMISPFNIRSLGYDTQITFANSPRPVDEEEEAEEEEEDETAYEDEEQQSTASTPAATPVTFRIGKLKQMLQFWSANASLMPGSGGAAMIDVPLTTFRPVQPPNLMEVLRERKMESLLDTMVSAAQLKRQSLRSLRSQPPSPSSSSTANTSSEASPDGSAPQNSSEAPAKPKVPYKTILHIRDYRELESTTSGTPLLKMLYEVVQRRRCDGEPILILGTSTEEAPNNLTKAGIRLLQSRPEQAVERTIVVPPTCSTRENLLFEEHHQARIREVNIRRLCDVIWRRSGEAGQAATLAVPERWHFTECDAAGNPAVVPTISDKFWPFDRVHRVATVALGERDRSAESMSIHDIAHAVALIDRSDAVKVLWAAQEREYARIKYEAEHQADADAAARKPKLPKDVNKHEKKLLAGVINPADLHTTFASIRAPDATIDSMKTLTTLSLVRPEAFKYGVLATDRIPGVLLYGPPGTGKTLLAKAVAKESGATVLEVAGSDIFDMYVGEGEKNVRAIFTLAKKLSPCVIFIDEADAIFGSRSSHSGRSTHREIINQFLKEWADLQTTAFIMVATNRPFDLDDAVLRRLPRRILIDLPTPADREAILRIHLQGETLAADVDLADLAARTPLYSGSDLKNVCVSAALAAVKEENAAARTRRTAKFPEKRTLRKHHFEKALAEISASISDDMSSLAAIRKFDEKYGERAGKKKKGHWGFAVGQDEEARRGEARVRQE